MTTSVFELLRVPSDRHSFSSVLVLCFSATLVAAVAAGAYFSDYEIRFSVLYLAPIALATWFAGQRAGTFITVISSVSWMIAFWSSRPHSPPFYFFWEGSMTIALHNLIGDRIRREPQFGTSVRFHFRPLMRECAHSTG